MRHLIEPTDLSVDETERIIDLALDIIAHREKYSEACKGRKLATLFYEPSTRTRLSFTSAMMERWAATSSVFRTPRRRRCRRAKRWPTRCA